MGNTERQHLRGRVVAGLLIIVFGTGWLLQNMDIPVPAWLWSWPMILIVVGLFIGVKSGFNDLAWIIIIAIGAFFLTDKIVPFSYEWKKFFWPIAIIGWGLLVIFGAKLRSRKIRSNHPTQETDQNISNNYQGPMNINVGSSTSIKSGPEDFLDSVSIFGGCKKIIISKNFQGADIVNIFGGSELNLSQADFKTAPVMDITQMFGGTKLIVPADWEVKSEMTSIFGGIDDKRQPRVSSEPPEKVVILRGTSIFGGIEIKNF